MLRKIKFKLLCWLLEDQKLLNQLYIKQVLSHAIDYEKKGPYEIRVSYIK